MSSCCSVADPSVRRCYRAMEVFISAHSSDPSLVARSFGQLISTCLHLDRRALVVRRSPHTHLPSLLERSNVERGTTRTRCQRSSRIRTRIRETVRTLWALPAPLLIHIPPTTVLFSTLAFLFLPITANPVPAPRTRTRIRRSLLLSLSLSHPHSRSHSRSHFLSPTLPLSHSLATTTTTTR